MAGGGYTPDAIDAMPAADAFALLAWWRDHPPAHEVLAAAFKVQPAPAPDPGDPSGIGDLIRRRPGGE